MALIYNKVQQATDKVVARGKVTSFDPTIILMIVAAVVELIKMWQECRKDPEEALDSAQRPGILTRWIVRRVLRRNLGKKYDEFGDDVKEALLEVARDTNIDEMKQMYDEASIEPKF